MLKKTLAAVLAVTLVLVLAVSASALTYQDTVNHWARAAIDRWSSYGIIVGDAGGFRPDDPMRRDEYSQVLTVLLELTEQSPAGTFVDVPEGHWYTAPSLKAHAAGLMMGDNHRRFAPKNRISREQAIVILARALGLEPDPDPDAVLARFGDASQVSGWAKPYVAAMVKAGYVAGLTTTTLGPKQNITRASILQLMDATIAYYVDEDDQEINVPKGTAGVVLIVADDAKVRTEDDVRIVVAEEDADVSLQGSTGKPTVVPTANNVTITDAPAGTVVDVPEGVTGTTVNGQPVAAGQTVVVPGEEEPGTVIPVVPATYTVTFDLNYVGAPDPPESQTVTSGQTATEPGTNPTRTNYTFGGWAIRDGEEGSYTSTNFDFDTAITADTILYARWLALGELYPATLHDTRNEKTGDAGAAAVADDDLYTDYELSVDDGATGTVDANGQIPVTISVRNLAKHNNTEDLSAYWFGLAIVAPESATQAKVSLDQTLGGNAEVRTVTTIHETDKGIAQYYGFLNPKTSEQMAALAPKYLTIQWLNGSAALGDPVTYKITRDVTMLAAAPTVTIDKAFLHDNATPSPVADDELVPAGQYKVMKGEASPDGVIPIDVIAYGVRQHKNAEQVDGYWAGVAFAKPEGAVALKGVVSSSETIGALEKTTMEDNVLNGQQGYTLYFGGAGVNERYLRLQWLGENDAPLGEAQTYKITYYITPASNLNQG